MKADSSTPAATAKPTSAISGEIINRPKLVASTRPAAATAGPAARMAVAAA